MESNSCFDIFRPPFFSVGIDGDPDIPGARSVEFRIDDPLISFRYMESLQKLTQHVQKKMEERKAQTLLVTSVLEKEGRSTVAENLALALSMRKEKVFLLNADFRKQNASWLADEEGHLKIENFQKLLEKIFIFTLYDIMYVQVFWEIIICQVK